jgi:hypothetical protein
MAEPQARGFRNFLGRVADRVVPGNNWNPTAPQGQRWSATPVQYLGAAGGVVGNMVAPGVGNLIRSGVHGATTGDGMFGWMQRNGGNMQLQPMGLDPVQSMPFNAGQYNSGGPMRSFMEGGQNMSPQFDPSNPFGVPQQPQPQAPQTGNNFFGPFTPRNQMAPMAAPFQSMLSNQGGGARGMHSGGGYVGESARNMFAGMHRAAATNPLVDYSRNPYQQ